MPRNKRPDPPIQLRVSIPLSLNQRLEAFLHSELDEGVPYGARSDLVSELLMQYLNLVAPIGGEENEP